MLTLYRRHLTGTNAKGGPLCAHADKGRAYTKCSCPIWADGDVEGRGHVRQSLKTRDWQRAIRKLAALEDPNAAQCKAITEATAAFEEHYHDRAPATRSKLAVTMRELRTYCKDAGLSDLSEITLEHLDAFRTSRKLGPLATLRELGRLRYFFKFCLKRKWITDNPAADSEAPRNIRPPEVVPYEAAEVAKMLAAADGIGKAGYERLRARALILVLRYTGLRITDAITLERGRINDGQLLLHTQKTGGMVFLPIPTELQAALDSLPCPRGTVGQPRYFFWNGIMSKRATKGTAERTLAAVFKASKVAGAHAHRFRHTLATDILVKGGTEQDVADILGISPAIVRKHYAKWSQARQRRITDLMRAVYSGTYTVREKNASVIN
jgi:site-specific recombinase XerD